MSSLAVRPAVDEIPLEERVRLKKNGFAVTPSVPHREEDGEEDVEANDDDATTADYHVDRGNPKDRTRLRRANKNCPLELSSKSTVGRLRQVVRVAKKQLVDPRFERTAGKLNEDLFHKSYAFLNEYKVGMMLDA